MVVRLLPGGSVNDELGALLFDQRPGSGRRRLRNDDEHGDGEMTAGVGDGDARVATGRRDEARRAAAGVFLARRSDAADLE